MTLTFQQFTATRRPVLDLGEIEPSLAHMTENPCFVYTDPRQPVSGAWAFVERRADGRFDVEITYAIRTFDRLEDAERFLWDEYASVEWAA